MEQATKLMAGISTQDSRENGDSLFPRAGAADDCLDDTALSRRLDALKKHAEGLLRDLSVLSEALASRQTRDISLADEVQRYETDLIRSALIRTGGRQRRAARMLNMKIATLNAKIKRYHLDADNLIREASDQRRQLS